MWQKHRTTLIITAIIILLGLMSLQGMSTRDWVITLLRGLSVGAVTFLVAAGLSLIFGLLDVLNLAHGTLFMLGAYIGWTVYVRPDTFVDLMTPLALLAVGFVLMPLWRKLLSRMTLRVWPWIGLALAALLLWVALPRLSIAGWSLDEYARSPISYALMLDQGRLIVPAPVRLGLFPAILGLGGLFLGGIAAGISLTALTKQRAAATAQQVSRQALGTSLSAAALLAASGVALFWFNEALTNWLLNLGTIWLFALAILVGALATALLGALMEMTLIRPLYDRPIYQLMLTLGLAVIGHEVVVTVWGRPEFTMPKPAPFSGAGDGCPAETLGDWLTHWCSTFSVLGGRVRTYNEIFVILVGLVVLAAVTLILQRSRLGMIIRAGVQDSEMVEALGINVRRVFTLVFALGAGLAGLGGVIAAPSMGLSPVMGENVLILALIALAIGGLTSFPGAAAGSLLVGLLQQFIIKYGQIGIDLPLLPEPFKPSPTLVPASTVLLMVIILLLMPQGLFGRKE